MSGADWHGVPLPDLDHVLPVLLDPLTGVSVGGSYYIALTGT
eukprot:COSAG04_NODE_15285_length_537_cov_0.547945_1_plen_42_part_01